MQLIDPTSGPWPADIDQSIRRIALAYRAVAVVWSGVLVLSAIIFDVAVPRRWVLYLALILMAAWSVTLGWLHLRAPDLLSHPVVLVVDVATAAGALFVPALAGNTTSLEFSAGYPLSSVALAVALGGSRQAAAAGITLLAAALTRRFLVFGDPTLGNVVSDFMVWLFPTFLLIWAAAVIRRFDRDRREAQEALAAARAEQARLAERQEVAAHLHDSVLQTLALIQRDPGDTEAVAALARTQERELRSWLYGGSADPEASMRAAVEAVCAEVEDLHRVTVDLVTSGDAPMRDGIGALVGAAREAVINAAKHAGTGSVSVFAEVADGVARIYVRDRGLGYDPDMVGDDRLGVRDSIKGRMARHGGHAEVLTAPGKGTEVRLEMPLDV